MREGTDRGLGLLIGTPLFCLLFCLTAAVASKENAKTAANGVLFPPNRVVLLSGNFDVICRGTKAALKVNGRARPWEPFESPLRVSHLTLAPGVHEVQIGNRRIEFSVAMNEEEHDGPEDWKIFRYHPVTSGKKRCAACHETRPNGKTTTVGKLKSHKACFECHESADLEVDHSHIQEPLEACQTCHALHGSSRKSLLKAR